MMKDYHYLIDEKGGLEFLKKEFDKRKTFKEIASNVNYPYTDYDRFIRSYLKTNNVTKEELGYTTLEDQLDRLGGVKYIQDKKLQGYTGNRLAKELGYASQTSINNYLKKHDTSWKELKSVKKSKLVDAGGIDYVFQEKMKGKTQLEIAHEIGYAEGSYIRRQLKTEGISWEDIPGHSKRKEYAPRSMTEKLKKLDEIFISKKSFYCQDDMADELGVTVKTLRNWIDRSEYSWDDFIKHRKTVKEKLIESGGVEYLESEFRKGKKIRDIANEWGVNESRLTQIINDFLSEVNVTKEELGYVKYHRTKTEQMFELIEGKGGLPYILESKMNGENLYGIAEDIGQGMMREYIIRYLGQYGLKFVDFYSCDDVYYVPNLKKWRGTFIVKGEVYDTGLCDSIWDAIDQVKLLRKNV